VPFVSDFIYTAHLFPLSFGVEIPEILMTHEAERSEDDMRVVRATAVFVHKLVQRHGKRKGEAMAVSQEEVASFHGTCSTFFLTRLIDCHNLGVFSFVASAISSDCTGQCLWSAGSSDSKIHRSWLVSVRRVDKSLLHAKHRLLTFCCF
jgi:hypothetical protein